MYYFEPGFPGGCIRYSTSSLRFSASAITPTKSSVFHIPANHQGYSECRHVASKATYLRVIYGMTYSAIFMQDKNRAFTLSALWLALHVIRHHLAAARICRITILPSWRCQLAAVKPRIARPPITSTKSASQPSGLCNGYLSPSWERAGFAINLLYYSTNELLDNIN